MFTSSDSLAVQSLSPAAATPIVPAYPIGFPLPKDSTFIAGQRELWDATSRAITWQYEEVDFPAVGVVGEPIPYQFRNDDVVTSSLLISFLLMVWVLSHSWKFLRDLMKEFFRHRLRGNLFVDKADAKLRGRGVLLVQAAFMHGILYYDYVQYELPDVFEQVSPYMMLAAATGLIVGYYLLKVAAYRMVNATFFPSPNNRMWDDHLLASVLLTGCLLLPLTLLVVYFDLPFHETLLSYVLLVAFVKSLLFYKGYRIFFSTSLGKLHIILYFCALEIVPLLMLWGVLQFISRYLVALS